MSTPAKFRRAAEEADLPTISTLLSDAIIFHSPVTFHPFIGRETVTRLLELVSQTFENFHYTDELQTHGAHGLIFRAMVAEREIEGIDLLRLDESDLICDFTVMLRPISALIPFAQIMGEKVAVAGLSTTRD